MVKMADGRKQQQQPGADEKMVVDIEYSDLPEVVPTPPPAPSNTRISEAPSPNSNATFSAYPTSLVSPISPYQQQSTIAPGPAPAGNNTLLQPDITGSGKRPHHQSPWSPASLESLNPRMSTQQQQPPPYDFASSEPPSPSYSQLSHAPLSPMDGMGGGGGGIGRPYSPALLQQPQSLGGYAPLGPTQQQQPFPSGLGGAGGAMLGPVAAARRRRRRTRWLVCGGVCAVIVLLAVGLGVGVAVGWIRVRWNGSGGGSSGGIVED